MLYLICLLFFRSSQHEVFLLSSTLTVLITINPLRRLMIFYTAHGSNFPQNWKENKSMEMTCLRVWNYFALFKSDRGSSFGKQRGISKWLSWFSIRSCSEFCKGIWVPVVIVVDGNQKEKNERQSMYFLFFASETMLFQPSLVIHMNSSAPFFSCLLHFSKLFVWISVFGIISVPVMSFQDTGY